MYVRTASDIDVPSVLVMGNFTSLQRGHFNRPGRLERFLLRGSLAVRLLQKTKIPACGARILRTHDQDR